MSTEIAFPRRSMRIRGVAKKTGLAESSIWRLAQQGQFPAPIKLSPGCTAWFEHEIDEWLDVKGSKRETALPHEMSEREGNR
jgi:prophage regulatory protein